jgi:hypothetical protein
MIAPQDPPGFVVRTEAQKAASNNGFRSERGTEAGWLKFESTTVRGAIWIAGISTGGPWLLSVGRREVAAEIGLLPQSQNIGPGAETFLFETLATLYETLEHVYRLSLSLPDAPLNNFHAAVRDLPSSTEAERLVMQRIGQDIFREALIAYWGGRCPLTGITNTELLRASHIVPWALCETDQQRLDVHNGLLLSALWDAAFDTGLVGFSDDGSVIASHRLSPNAATALRLHEVGKLFGLTHLHKQMLAWHRSRYGL